MKSRFYSLPFACAFTLAFPTVLAPATAAAQEPAGDANAQYRKAFEALAQKNWTEARRLLLPLWNSSHTWDVASGLGQAEFLLKNHAAGATYMAFALANVPPKEKPQTVERLRAALTEMKESVGTVRIAVNKDGAEIAADHEVVGTSPLSREVFLNPGPRVLEARLPKGGAGKETLEVEAGKTYEVAIIVEKQSAGPPATTAAPVATTQTATPPPNTPPPAPTDSARPNWTPVLITGGLAVVAAAVGTGFAINANSAKKDGEQALKAAEAEFGSNPCTPTKGEDSAACQSVKEHQDQRNSSVTVATVSFITSGVFAAAAVGSYFLWAKPHSPKLDAWFGPNGGGLRFNGSF